MLATRKVAERTRITKKKDRSGSSLSLMWKGQGWGGWKGGGVLASVGGGAARLAEGVPARGDDGVLHQLKAHRTLGADP